MSDSSGDELQEWIPYAQRKEWADVKPLEQNEGKEPVAKIAYSAKFVDVYNYFRAIVCSGEVSQRALNLTQDAAELNPANYSVWHHRRILLKKLDCNLSQEMDYCRAVIEEHPKNYQVWQHRRALVEALQDGSRELRLTEMILSQDAKNYHAWQHRQWAIKTFNMHEQELSYVERLLEEDIRNNSAWNQRFFIISSFHSCPQGPVGDGGDVKKAPKTICVSGKVLEREVEFTFDAIRKVTRNESAWNYLRGLLDHCDKNESDSLKTKVHAFCSEILNDGELHPDKTTSPYLLATLIDLDREEGAKEHNKTKLENAVRMCNLLATEHDVIRKEYWNYMADCIQKQIA